jgi:hypothetical protein
VFPPSAIGRILGYLGWVVRLCDGYRSLVAYNCMLWVLVRCKGLSIVYMCE